MLTMTNAAKDDSLLWNYIRDTDQPNRSVNTAHLDTVHELAKLGYERVALFSTYDKSKTLVFAYSKAQNYSGNLTHLVGEITGPADSEIQLYPKSIQFDSAMRIKQYGDFGIYIIAPVSDMHSFFEISIVDFTTSKRVVPVFAKSDNCIDILKRDGDLKNFEYYVTSYVDRRITNVASDAFIALSQVESIPEEINYNQPDELSLTVGSSTLAITKVTLSFDHNTKNAEYAKSEPVYLAASKMPFISVYSTESRGLRPYMSKQSVYDTAMQISESKKTNASDECYYLDLKRILTPDFSSLSIEHTQLGVYLAAKDYSKLLKFLNQNYSTESYWKFTEMFSPDVIIELLEMNTDFLDDARKNPSRMISTARSLFMKSLDSDNAEVSLTRKYAERFFVSLQLPLEQLIDEPISLGMFIRLIQLQSTSSLFDISCDINTDFSIPNTSFELLESYVQFDAEVKRLLFAAKYLSMRELHRELVPSVAGLMERFDRQVFDSFTEEDLRELAANKLNKKSMQL